MILITFVTQNGVSNVPGISDRLFGYYPNIVWMDDVSDSRPQIYTSGGKQRTLKISILRIVLFWSYLLQNFKTAASTYDRQAIAERSYFGPENQ